MIRSSREITTMPERPVGQPPGQYGIIQPIWHIKVGECALVETRPTGLLNSRYVCQIVHKFGHAYSRRYATRRDGKYLRVWRLV